MAAAGRLQVLVFHQRRVLPLRRPNLRIETRKLDVRRVQGECHCPGRIARTYRLPAGRIRKRR